MRLASEILVLALALAAIPHAASQHGEGHPAVVETSNQQHPTERVGQHGAAADSGDPQHPTEESHRGGQSSHESASVESLRGAAIPSHDVPGDGAANLAPCDSKGHQHIGEDDSVVDFADHNSMTRVLFALIMCLSLGLILSHYLHHAHIEWLPESTFFILLGVGLGLLLRGVFGRHHLTSYFGTVNTAVLNFVLLPPIIFESGWSLRWKDFVSQFEYILIFALGGTVIATMTTALMIQQTGVIAEWHTIFTFASLISAVDPVATLATYSKLKVEPLLNIMVFGESVINDAVAIALFKAGNSVSAGGELTVHGAFSSVVRLLFGSITLGLLLGAAVHVIIQRMGMNDADVGISTIGLTAYIAYTMAEAVHLSGIIATLFCGIFMGALLHPTMTPEAARVTDMTLMRSAVRADIVIFMFVGAAICLIEESKGFVFGLQVSAFCIISRALAVFPLGLLCNLIKRATGKSRNVLSMSHLFMMWHGGLRGGIAMALVLEVESEDPEEKDKLQEATFIIIVVFLLVFGGSTKYFLTLLKIPIGDNSHEDVLITKVQKTSTIRKGKPTKNRFSAASASVTSNAGWMTGDVEMIEAQPSMQLSVLTRVAEELDLTWNADGSLAAQMLAPAPSPPSPKSPTPSRIFRVRHPGKPVVGSADASLWQPTTEAMSTQSSETAASIPQSLLARSGGYSPRLTPPSQLPGSSVP